MENNNRSNFDFGSKTTSIYTERQVRVFAIHEPELDMLSNFNNISTLFFSISTWCLTTAFDRWGTDKEIISYILFGITSLIVGVVIWYKKRGITNKIKMESKNITKPPA
jgi:hypothetical protein